MAFPDVVIIGAGVVGAACAFYAARAGLSVTVVDRGAVAAGATATGQGLVHAATRAPGPALELALESLRRWEELGADLGAARLELTRKGSLAVAATPADRAALADLAARQRTAGLAAVDVGGDDLRDYEPLLAPGLAGGVHYPHELQVDAVVAAAHLLRASGADVRFGVDVRAMELDAGMRVAGVRTARRERIACGAVVNAAGVGGGDVAALAGTGLPIIPGRGFLLVTEPFGAPRPGRRHPPPIRHAVYAAASQAPARRPEGAASVTGTRAGALLIGASRERAGLDRSWPLPVLRALAARAVALFPFLAGVSVIGVVRGFRPDTPDQLPIIGPDPWVRGLYHACGHAGAGVTLAPATGALVADMLTESPAAVAAAFPFHPERFG